MKAATVHLRSVARFSFLPVTKKLVYYIVAYQPIGLAGSVGYPGSLALE